MNTIRFFIYAQAIASILIWIKLMYYVRMFKQTSYLVRTAVVGISDLGPFMLICFIGCLAFGDAFYVASKYHKKFKFDESETYFPDYVSAFMESYNYLFGLYGYTINYSKSVLAFLIY